MQEQKARAERAESVARQLESRVREDDKFMDKLSEEARAATSRADLAARQAAHLAEKI